MWTRSRWSPPVAPPVDDQPGALTDALELQAIAASRAHVELMAKLATAAQSLEPEERLARERQTEAARLVAATFGAVDELVDRGDFPPAMAQELRERVAVRLNGSPALDAG